MKTMNEPKDDVNIKKAEFYKKNGTKVHLSLKSGRFYNGKIGDVAADFLIIFDSRIGQTPVFFVELKETGIEAYNEEDK